MVFALISLVVACVIMTSSKLDSSYELLHIISKKHKDETQRFRSKSLFWAIISTLVFLILIVAFSDFYEISKFGTNWNSTTIFMYYLIVVCLVLSPFVCGVISMIIVVRAKKRGKLIALPMFLLCINRRRQTLNYIQGNVILFYQFIGSFTILLTSVAVSFHGTGIVIAALANPLQVFSAVATIVVNVFYLTYAYADIYDSYEDMFKTLPLPNFRSEVLFFILRLPTHVLVILLIVLFSYTYITDVIFVGSNNFGVIGFIANLLPIILVTFITWLYKNELQNYFKIKSSSNSNTAENPSFVEISTV